MVFQVLGNLFFWKHTSKKGLTVLNDRSALISLYILIDNGSCNYLWGYRATTYHQLKVKGGNHMNFFSHFLGMMNKASFQPKVISFCYNKAWIRKNIWLAILYAAVLYTFSILGWWCPFNLIARLTCIMWQLGIINHHGTYKLSSYFYML